MFVIITTEKNNGGHVRLAKFRKGGNRHGCEKHAQLYIQYMYNCMHTRSFVELK